MSHCSMQEADIESAAGDVELRMHALETLTRALRSGWPVHIVSVNWSASFIKGTLTGIPCCVSDAGDGNVADDTPAQVVMIHANSLEMKLGVSTGAPRCACTCGLRCPLSVASKNFDVAQQ
jgi:hypothetical protein